MIELRELNKSYHINGHQFEALKNINLTIQKGEIFGIFGESGAGKSTLLRSINLLEKPTSGQVLINGQDLTSLSSSALKTERHRIGMIFQHFNLLESRTAFENIALPLELQNVPKEKIKEKVTALLALVDLKDRGHHYPSQLSGGQKQRVAIARALATDPYLLLCDEATSALDPKATQAILNLLKSINEKLGVTIVLITHEMDVIKQICHRAAVLDQGNLIEEGTIIALFAKPKTAVTKQLVQKSLHSELPKPIIARLQTEPSTKKSHLVRFTFVGEESTQPLIMTLVQKFNITVNIIQANLEMIQDATIGYTICQLSGEHDAINQALASLNPSSIHAEVIGYV